MANNSGKKRDRRLADMSAEESTDFLAQFDPDELKEQRFDFDLGPEARCIQKMMDHRNRVVWFAIMVEVFHEGAWVQIARADTCHDEAHVHWWVRGRRTEKDRQALRKIATIDDVAAAFDEACDLMTEDWERNVRRWEDGS